MPKDTVLVAAEWQLAQANGLSAIILPLVPAPILVDTKDCSIPRGKEWRWFLPQAYAAWGESGAVSELVLRYLSYQVGDRIYLQEPGAPARYFCEGEPAGVQSVEVTGVRLLQMKDLERPLLYSARLNDALPERITSDGVWDSVALAAKRWNEAHPETPWNADRWVIVLGVKGLY